MAYMKKKNSVLKLRIVMFFTALSVLNGLSAENDDSCNFPKWKDFLIVLLPVSCNTKLTLK